MADYQPLDLSALCNAGLEVLGANANYRSPCSDSPADASVGDTTLMRIKK